jgi:hypothetical protein
MEKQVLVRVQPLADGLGQFLSVELDAVIIEGLIMLKNLVAVGIKNFKLLNSLIVLGMGT